MGFAYYTVKGSPELLAQESLNKIISQSTHTFSLYGQNQKNKIASSGYWVAQVNVNMNKLKVKLTIFFLIVSVTAAFSQATIKSTNYNVDGYWGKWENLYLGLTMTGTYSSFVIHDNSKHPSQYGCKITIYNYNDNISKKEKKRRRKKNEWYTYSKHSINYSH